MRLLHFLFSCLVLRTSMILLRAVTRIQTVKFKPTSVSTTSGTSSTLQQYNKNTQNNTFNNKNHRTKNFKNRNHPTTTQRSRSTFSINTFNNRNPQTNTFHYRNVPTTTQRSTTDNTRDELIGIFSFLLMVVAAVGMAVCGAYRFYRNSDRNGYLLQENE